MDEKKIKIDPNHVVSLNDEIILKVKILDWRLQFFDEKKALNARLKDLAQNFEEATVDKKEQEEKVIKMKQKLQTASELNGVNSFYLSKNKQKNHHFDLIYLIYSIN
jgi:hypothetical protein